MNKIKTLLVRAGSGSFKRFFRNLQLAHQRSGKNRIWLFFDMTYSMFAHGIGYLDYLTFNFASIGKEKRRTFMTYDDNIALVRRMNQREAYPLLNDKLLFFQTYGPFMHRDWVDLQAGYEGFAAFCQGKDTFFAKQPVSFGGTGVEKIRLEGQDLHELYGQLMDKKMFLAEQTICQHPEMDKLCSRSVNTVRIVTILSDRGNANVVYALVRIGSGQNDVDNISSGGMYTLLSPEGAITMPVFCDKTVSYYTSHPMTGFAFEGFTVPYFQEALELCRQAAQVEPRLRYIGWDVAITPDGPVLVEGNNLPGYDMCQNYRFHADGCGMKQAFVDAEAN